MPQARRGISVYSVHAGGEMLPSYLQNPTTALRPSVSAGGYSGDVEENEVTDPVDPRSSGGTACKVWISRLRGACTLSARPMVETKRPFTLHHQRKAKFCWPFLVSSSWVQRYSCHFSLLLDHE